MKPRKPQEFGKKIHLHKILDLILPNLLLIYPLLVVGASWVVYLHRKVLVYISWLDASFNDGFQWVIIELHIIWFLQNLAVYLVVVNMIMLLEAYYMFFCSFHGGVEKFFLKYACYFENVFSKGNLHEEDFSSGSWKYKLISKPSLEINSQIFSLVCRPMIFIIVIQ